MGGGAAVRRLRGGVSSPAFKQGGGGVLRCGSEERAKERTKSSPGVCVVLGRSLEEGGELCPGLSTAASRWRPPGRLWKRRGAWHGKKRASARLEGGGGGRPRRVGASARRINGRNGREGVGGGAVGGVGGENRAGRWEMEIRAILQLPKIPGTKL